MKYLPKPHQSYCIDLLTKPLFPESKGLFLDMGMGKTAITLTAIANLLDDFAINKVLVIAPLRVAEDTWTTEAQKWEHTRHLRVIPVLGTAKKRTKQLCRTGDIFVINRENVEWLCDPKASGLKKWDFDLVVIDELSSFKNNQAKRWRALKRRMPPDCPVWGLTGTPAPKSYIDLWPQIFLLDRGQRLGTTLGSYREKYFNPGARRGHVVFDWRLKRGAKEAIDNRLSDLCIAMRKEDYLSLPPITYNRVAVRMDKKERAIYDELKREKVLAELEGKELDSAIVGATAAALSNKLLQLSGGAVYDEDGGVQVIHKRKLDALVELEEAAQGQPLLVFYAYKHEADRIMEKFPHAVLISDPKSFTAFNPAMPRKIGTSEIIAAWNAGEIAMLLCHPASAGHGLNLQAGGHMVVWYSLPWSLELYQQANARLHRMGQESPVIVHHIICEDTLDDRVLTVLGQREESQDGLLRALKAYIIEEEAT